MYLQVMRERKYLVSYSEKIYTKLFEQTDQGANLDTATLTAREFSGFFDELLNDFGHERPDGLHLMKKSIIEKWSKFNK